jgi:hypothetical protein
LKEENGIAQKMKKPLKKQGMTQQKIMLLELG